MIKEIWVCGVYEKLYILNLCFSPLYFKFENKINFDPD